MKINLPAWLRRDGLKLPPWAKVAKQRKNASIRLEVDTEKAMDEWFELLGNPPRTQYWTEVAYQCVKLDMQAVIAGTEFDPRQAGKFAEFHFLRAPKYEQAKLPDPDKGSKVKINGVERVVGGREKATQGKEARGHYVRVRGSLPL